MQPIENNISGNANINSFIQANHSKKLSPEVTELVNIYEKLNGRKRFELLKFAVELEEQVTENTTDDKKEH